MEKPTEFNLAITPILQNLKDYFENHSHDKSLPSDSDFFRKIAKATVIKAYEFAASINLYNEDYMFFNIPSLRGICEDYIVEKFIYDYFFENRDEIIRLRLMQNHYKSCIAQWEYFSINKGEQFLYYDDSFPIMLKDIEDQLKIIVKAKLPNLTKSFPSIYYMCKQTGLLELYNYLYHATSTFVHFSPHNLLRMGWGDLPDIQFSSVNFKKYYKDFSLFYSVLLLHKICKWQNNSSLLPSFNVNNLISMDDVLQNAKQWPELVTFEEMNISVIRKYLSFKSPNQAKSVM